MRALVAHRAPLLAQPAMLASHRGGRASDRSSLNAMLGSPSSDLSLTLWVGGRDRLADDFSRRWSLEHAIPGNMHPASDVESTCPLIDARVLPALFVACAPSHRL